MAYAAELGTLCDGRLSLLEAKWNGIADLRALLAAQPSGTIAYICGPGVMIEALRDAATELGWERDRVRFEVFNAAHGRTTTTSTCRCSPVAASTSGRG